MELRNQGLSECRVKNAPAERPLVVWDGECGFCRTWIERWREETGGRVDYAPYQEVAERFPEIAREDFARAMKFIETDGRVFSAAEATLRALAYGPDTRWMLRIYRRVPGAARCAETCYRFIAAHRSGMGALTRLLWGRRVAKPRHVLTRWIFLRALGLIYLIAFWSLGTQILGLSGSEGIMPAREIMEGVRRHIGSANWFQFPTLCWWSSSDAFLSGMCWGGVALSALLFVGVAPPLILLANWLLYLSLTMVCEPFLSFQWDILLIETGFLAIFFSPVQLLPNLKREKPPSRAVLWGLRWLLFRLMFLSGAVKLTSGDPTWRDFTALNYHYETQPLANWVSWYAFQLPEWFQKFSVAMMYGAELGAPLLIFAPRRLRFFGAWAIIVFQSLIIITGNYCFFNWLTIALCLLLFDDAAWPKWTGRAAERWKGFPRLSGCVSWTRWVTRPLVAALLALNVMVMCQTLGVRISWPRPLLALESFENTYNIVNSYGLFRVMTTSRPEIIVQGSNDAIEWKSYEFKYKAGDLMQRPGFVAPHQPRLDWQMWFAALGSVRGSEWFVRFCARLLEGSPRVLTLLATNPFPDAPPIYIRAVVYEYHFTNFAERRETGAWWKRDQMRGYMPPVSLRKN